MKMVLRGEAILTLFTLLAIVATVRFTLAVWLGQKIVPSQSGLSRRQPNAYCFIGGASLL